VSTVATPGEWQCKIRTGGMRRLAVANGSNIFQMLLVDQSINQSINQSFHFISFHLFAQMNITGNNTYM